jgi:hypothetical protein
MKKKVKWLVLIICLIVFASIVSGRGSSSSEETKQVVTNDQADTADNEMESAESDNDGEQSETQVDGTDDFETAADATVTIDEQVLVDQDNLVITALEYVTDSIWGDGIKLLLENNSDTDVTIGCTALIVNDYMISDLFVSDVAAGKKANEILYLSSSQLEAAGIENVGQVEIYFHVYDSTTYDSIFDTDCVTIRTSEYVNMDTTPNDAGNELYNENDIRIVGKTVDENSFWGTAILLYCENNSGKNVGISVDGMSINGFMMEPYFSTTVYDGKKSIDDITVFSSDLEKNGIESIEEVELKFHIYDEESYSTIADSAPITFSAQ